MDDRFAKLLDCFLIGPELVRAVVRVAGGDTAHAEPVSPSLRHEPDVVQAGIAGQEKDDLAARRAGKAARGIEDRRSGVPAVVGAEMNRGIEPVAPARDRTAGQGVTLFGEFGSFDGFGTEVVACASVFDAQRDQGAAKGVGGGSSAPLRRRRSLS